MKTRGLIMAVAMAFSSAAYAAEPVRQAGVQGTVNASNAARPSTRLDVIVYPDGGGLDADPDIGQSAMSLPRADTPAAIRRH